MATFKEIIKKLEEIVNDLPQVNSFGWGNIPDLHTNEHKFPMIWVNPKESSTLSNINTYNFDIYMLDILEQDKSNLLDIMNSTMAFGNEFISDVYNIDEEFFTLKDDDVKLTPFEGRFDELLGSWIFSFMIKTKMGACSK